MGFEISVIDDNAKLKTVCVMKEFWIRESFPWISMTKVKLKQLFNM